MGRPRKIIMCVDSDDERLRYHSFVFDVWGYDVRQAMSIAEAIDAARHVNPYDLRACVSRIELFDGSGDVLACHLKHISPVVRCLLLSPDYVSDEPVLHANFVLYRHDCNMQNIREKLKVLAAIKRGPRPVLCVGHELETLMPLSYEMATPQG